MYVGCLTVPPDPLSKKCLTTLEIDIGIVNGQCYRGPSYGWGEPTSTTRVPSKPPNHIDKHVLQDSVQRDISSVSISNIRWSRADLKGPLRRSYEAEPSPATSNLFRTQSSTEPTVNPRDQLSRYLVRSRH